MKVLVPPTECECSISSGPFLENDDVTKRKLSPFETYSIGHKRAKKKGKAPNVFLGEIFFPLINRL